MRALSRSGVEERIEEQSRHVVIVDEEGRNRSWLETFAGKGYRNREREREREKRGAVAAERTCSAIP